MKIHDLTDSEGRVFAFEISNTFFSRKKLCKFVQSIPETQILKTPSIRSSLKVDDEFCEFETRGQKFVAWEPFGDNSRYWIGPKPALWCEQVSLVKNAFANHKLFGFF
jgi:hypothetical protein